MDSPLAARLETLVDVFAGAATQCMQSLFRHQWRAEPAWRVVEALQIDAPCIVALTCANERYRSLALVGLEEQGLAALNMACPPDIDDALDVFGELINTYCGVLADDEQFRAAFGVLTQSMPLMHVRGEWTLRPMTGIEGCLEREGCAIHFLYGIQPQQRED